MTKILSVLCLLCLTGCWDDSFSTTAETETCLKVDAKNNKCITLATEAKFIIVVNFRSNACSVKETMAETGKSYYTHSVSLAFIDTKNWQCKSVPTPSGTAKNGFKTGNEQTVYEMTDGHLRIYIDDLDGIAGHTEYQLKQTTPQ